MFEHRLDLSPLHCLWLISMPELTPAALPAVLLWDCWTARTRWRRRRGLGRTFRRRSARGCRTFLRRQRRTGRSELSSLTCRSTAGSPCGTSLIQDSASSRSFALSSMASESFPWLRNHSDRQRSPRHHRYRSHQNLSRTWHVGKHRRSAARQMSSTVASWRFHTLVGNGPLPSLAMIVLSARRSARSACPQPQARSRHSRCDHRGS